MARFGKGNAGRPKGAVNHATREIQEFAGAMLDDPEYKAALKVRLREGKAQHIEVLLFHYKHGKPRDTVAIEGTESLAELLEVAHARRDGGK